jgi:RepB DNA-primase from phage plasmid
MASRGFQVSVTGAKSYVAANQFRSGGRKRTERCIAKVRHLYHDLDTDCDTRLTSLRASEALLTPTALISTSPGKYQFRWRIDCSPFERQEGTLKLLCIAFGRDPVRTNVSRIPRPPGYVSCKYDTTYSITVEYPSDSTWNPDDFRLDIAASNAILLSCSIPSQKHSGKHTNFDHDWAWHRHDLDHGNGAAEQSSKKLVVGVESRVSVQVSKS